MKDSINTRYFRVSCDAGINFPLGNFGSVSPPSLNAFLNATYKSQPGFAFGKENPAGTGIGFAKQGINTDFWVWEPIKHSNCGIVGAFTYAENGLNSTEYINYAFINNSASQTVHMLSYSEYKLVGGVVGIGGSIELQKFVIDVAIMGGLMSCSSPYVYYYSNINGNLDTWNSTSSNSVAFCLNIGIYLHYFITNRLSALLSFGFLTAEPNFTAIQTSAYSGSIVEYSISSYPQDYSIASASLGITYEFGGIIKK